MRVIRPHLMFSGCVAAAMLSPTMAFAQDVPGSPAPQTAPEPETAPVREPAVTAPDQSLDIVVTAQRREERLQDVPIAVSAASADTLSRSGVTTAQDLQRITPGLQMAAVRNNIQPYLRGVGTQNTSPGEEGSIATYIDGVYINYQSAATFALPSVARVEVLKGPQGTLFGRNATGGLINIVTRDPGDVLTFVGDLSYASYDTVTGSAYLAAPLGSNLSASVTGYYSNQADGWGRNLVRNEDVNYKKEHLVLAKLLWEPGASTRVTLNGDIGRNDSDIGNTRAPLPGAILLGNIPARGGPYDSLANDLNSSVVKYGGASLNIAQTLPFATLSSLTAYRSYDEHTLLDQDGGPNRAIYADNTAPIKTFQQEITLRGDGERFDWTVGAIYYHATAGYQPSNSASTTPASNRRLDTELRTKSIAAYAQGTYAIFPRTRLTLGFRYTKDRREIDGQASALPGNAQPVGTVLQTSSQRKSFEEPAWRIALDHKLSDDVLIYVSQGRSFKSGIYSSTSFANPAVNPEVLNAVEAGFKSQFFDKQLLFNVSAFTYKYKDIQLVQVSAGTSRILNAASAKPKGFEIETVFAPHLDRGRFQIGGSLSIQDAEYERFPNAPKSTPLPTGGNLQSSADASGNDMIRAPKFSGQINADYSVPIGPGDFRLSGVFAHSAGFYFDPDNRVRQPSFETLNLRTSYTIGKVEIYGFIQNVTDERYLTAVSTTNLGDLAVYGKPRTIGGGVKVTL